ncbi:MAG: hypothetical protein GY934_05070, partial [Gammaproteobacteria bacterium]|nr:hypothetical protein [Gammaproteobacteria bacterium]
AGAARHALAGNLEQARNYANIAVAALKQGAGTGVLDFYKEQAALIEAEFSSTGKTSGEAFWNAFHGAGTASEDMMKRAMGRARVTAAKRDEGELTQSVNQRGLTPTQQTMFSKLTGEVAKLNSAASDLNTIMEKGVLDTISDLDAAMKRGEVSSQEFTTQMSGLKSELMQYVTSEQELRALREEGIITNTDYANSLVQVNENQARINNTFTIGSVTIEDYNRKLTEMQLKALATGTGVADGFKRGFLELGLEITNFSDVAQKTVTNAFAGMEDALVSFVTTGKVDFKGMVDSMLADLTRLLARQLVVKALGAMGNSAGGGLGALFSSAAGAATTRAGGGPTSPGGTYVINDDGKEMLHMGNQRGFVSNARDTKAAAPAAQAPIIVYNLWSDEDIGQYMNDDNKGGRIIVNKSPGQGRGQAR